MAAQEPTPQELKAINLGQVMALAQQLGLDEQFARDVAYRGQEAVIDRAQMVDATGAMGRLLLMLQTLGWFVSRKMAQGKPTPPGVLGEAMMMIARRNGVGPALGVEVMGTVFETFQNLAGQIARGETNEQAEPTTAGPSGVQPAA